MAFRTRVRRGLTLMELIVVLTILVALASVLIPMMPGMLNRAHTSTGATNVSELNKAVQTFEQLNFVYPDQLDALTDTAGAAPADYLSGLSANQLSIRTLTADDATTLTTAGIRNLAAMYATAATIPAGQDPTFNPYVLGAGNSITLIPVAAGAKVIQVSEPAVESVIVRDAGGTNGDVYVAFGVGKANTMIGKTMAQAPLHFPDNGGITPSNSYGRFGLTFRIVRGGTTPTPLARAEFVGVIEFHEEGIASSDDHIAEYYQNAK